MRDWLRRNTICAAALAAGWGLPTAATAQTVSSVRPTVPSSTAQTDPSRSESHWNVLGRSVEDRVIEYRQFGQGDIQVLLVGPLEGEETAAMDLMEQLAEHLERFSRRTNGVRVTLVRDPNPDGRLRRSPTNARGVRLDQNFPTRGWRKVPAGASWISGREPESESETRALVDLIGDVRPDRVIILAATRRQAELTYFGPAEALAREFAKSSGLRPAPANVTALQGSLAVYTGSDLQTPTLLVRVPAPMRRDQLWANYRRALLAAIGGDAEEGQSPPIADGKAVSPSGAQPWSVVAVAKRAPPDGVADAPPKEPASAPRILAADELEFGGQLVPVVRPPAAAVGNRGAPAPIQAPRRQFGPATQSVGGLRGQARSAPYPAGRAPQQLGGFPPARLMRASPTPNAMAPSMAPPKEVTSPGLKMVERLPAVDPATSPPRTLPQPIPLYPATGY